MAENDTLLAHLVPIFTRRYEDTATEALCYILNKSEASKAGFNELIQTVTGVVLDDCVRFETQVVADDKSRPDFVGYDRNSGKRTIGESKFWAALGTGQGNAYLEQLAKDGPATLLFVVPEARMAYLWSDVIKDIEQGKPGCEFEPLRNFEGVSAGRIAETNRHVIMVSWRVLLNKMIASSAGEPRTVSDIQQLQGLADRMDSEAFQPLQSSELGPEFARRASHFPKLVMDAVKRGVEEGWASTDGLRLAYQEYGFGQYIRLSHSVIWFGVNIYQWSQNGDTPLWINFNDRNLKSRLQAASPDGPMGLYEDWSGLWTPIYLETGSEREPVLANIVSQLKEIAEIIEKALSES